MSRIGDRLEGKTALVTGGARGIGRAAVELFCEHGARVAFLDTDVEGGKAFEEDLLAQYGSARFERCDVSRESDVRDAVERIMATFGSITVLYNNASVFLPNADGAIGEITPETWNRMHAVNLGGTYLCIRHVLPQMIAAGGGSIINTASSAAVIGVPNCSAYTSTKGAILAVTRSTAVEYGPKGVRANCIVPAGVETEMMKQSNPEDSSFDKEHFLAVGTPVRRFGTPREIAYVALFLASDESSYVNGAAIVADGGITICGDLSRPESV